LEILRIDLAIERVIGADIAAVGGGIVPVSEVLSEGEEGRSNLWRSRLTCTSMLRSKAICVDCGPRLARHDIQAPPGEAQNGPR